MPTAEALPFLVFFPGAGPCTVWSFSPRVGHFSVFGRIFFFFDSITPRLRRFDAPGRKFRHWSFFLHCLAIEIFAPLLAGRLIIRSIQTLFCFRLVLSALIPIVRFLGIAEGQISREGPFAGTAFFTGVHESWRQGDLTLKVPGRATPIRVPCVPKSPTADRAVFPLNSNFSSFDPPELPFMAFWQGP